MATASTSVTAGKAQHEGELHVDAIGKQFGGLKVFDQVSFKLLPGDILGVVGPNGAGKTTLINIISGLLFPTHGRITLGGHDITRTVFHGRSRMGVIRSFQQTSTFRPATVRENIARAIRFSHGSEMPPRGMDALMKRFELSDRLDEQSDKLPYGLQKMLGLVLAYVTSPKVLLLDEPAAGLEIRERGRVDDFVHHVREELGCGMLIVEHDMDLIRRLCPQIMVLDSGRILAEGPPADVLARPEVIAAYMGAAEEVAEQC
ncbi:MAG: ATP-binding cassette domain-containing protein [Candidatus Korobacteraceae bacterium]|jgi:ABC-type branched-subunit amino acid transport system ATPase component